MSWIAWLIAAAALVVAEYFTLTLAFGLLAAAALVAAVLALVQSLRNCHSVMLDVPRANLVSSAVALREAPVV
jgi:hypothetical protein